MKRISTSKNRKVEAGVDGGDVMIRESVAYLSAGYERWGWDSAEVRLTLDELRKILALAEIEATK